MQCCGFVCGCTPVCNSYLLLANSEADSVFEANNQLAMAADLT